MTNLGVLKETAALEKRVALVPEGVKRLLAKNPSLKIAVEQGAGAAAGFTDELYSAAGATMCTRAEVLAVDVILTINSPTAAECTSVKKGALLVALHDPAARKTDIDALASRGVLPLVLEKIPRISRAQSMDVLSSQANLAGYRAVLEAATHYPKLFPLMMTSAGSAKPARVMVLGVGVAGLQAIATAKRLGAVVEAYDVRPEVKEQITSLGAKPIELDVGEQASGAGGYAKELSPEAKAKQQQALQDYLAKADVIITTAQIPGKPAPVLVTEAALKAMQPGSVVVDMAAASGGNCPLTEANKVVVKHGITLVGYTDYPSRMASTASSFFSRNMENLLGLIIKNSAVQMDGTDEILAASIAKPADGAKAA